MADKHTVKNVEFVDSSILSSEIISLASKRLEALCEESRREQVAKLLLNRRRKWRKKHKLVSRQEHLPLDPGLREQKEALGDSILRLNYLLVRKRDESIAAAVELQSNESMHCLEVFRDRLENEKILIQSYIKDHSLQDNAPPPPPPVEPDSDHLGIIMDLEATLAQAEAVAEIKKMKHTMTPRVPQLHNRTLSGNILDQSLGILHESMLDNNGVTSELLDSEHAHLQIIGKEVSISQEESEGIAAEFAGDDYHPRTSCEDDTGTNAVIQESRSTVAHSSPEKLSCSDDTPGIGMEVVCVGGSESDTSVVTQPVNEMEIVSSQNGIVNGFESFSESSIAAAIEQNVDIDDEEEEEETVDSDDIQKSILQLLQDAYYDLRFPVRRYSARESRGRHSPTSRTPVVSSTLVSSSVTPPTTQSSRKTANGKAMFGGSNSKATPPKSGRGGRKPSMGVVVDSTDTLPNTTNKGGGADMPTIKKKRGRKPNPHKNNLPATAGQTGVALSVTPRKRGRPRKHPIVSSSSFQ